jgi:hypothetical protein
MAIFKRKLKSGYTWRAVVRVTGFPTQCATFTRKQEAEDWGDIVKSCGPRNPLVSNEGY